MDGLREIPTVHNAASIMAKWMYNRSVVKKHVQKNKGKTLRAVLPKVATTPLTQVSEPLAQASDGRVNHGVRTELVLIWAAYSLLIANFIWTFVSWKPRWMNMAADEDVWVSNAIKYWKTGTRSPIVHVPLFHDLVAFFVGGAFVDSNRGYVIWKVLLYVTCLSLIFYVLRKVSSLWIGTVLTLHFEWLLWFYNGPTYTVLALTFFAASLALVATNRRLTGLAVGVLLLGSLVRLELFFAVIAAVVLLVSVAPRSVFSMTFLRGLLAPVVVFVGLIYWHGSTITAFPGEYFVRGESSVVWYVVDFLYERGSFHKYTDKPMGQIPPEATDRVLVDFFGKNKAELISSSPLELWRRNPKIMIERYADVFRGLPGDFAQLFAVEPRYRPSSPPSHWFSAFFFIALIPSLLGSIWLRARDGGLWGQVLGATGNPVLVVSPSTFSREFLVVTISGLAAFGPWLLTYPQPNYMLVSIPVAYIASAWFICWLTKRLDEVWLYLSQLQSESHAPLRSARKRAVPRRRVQSSR